MQRQDGFDLKVAQEVYTGLDDWSDSANSGRRPWFHVSELRSILFTETEVQKKEWPQGEVQKQVTGLGLTSLEMFIKSKIGLGRIAQEEGPWSEKTTGSRKDQIPERP